MCNVLSFMQRGTCDKARGWCSCCCSCALKGFHSGYWLEQEAHLWRQPHAPVPVHVCASQLPALPPMVLEALNGTPAATEHYLAGWCLSWRFSEWLQPLRSSLAWLPAQPDSLGMAALCCLLLLGCSTECSWACLPKVEIGLLKSYFVCDPRNKRCAGRHMVGVSVSWSCSAAAVESTFQVLYVVLSQVNEPGLNR